MCTRGSVVLSMYEAVCILFALSHLTQSLKYSIRYCKDNVTS